MNLLSKTVGAICLTGCFAAQAATPININTGIAAWNLGLDAAVIEVPTHPAWIPNFGGAYWVGPTAVAGAENGGAAPGIFDYTLNIGALSGNVGGSFNLQFAADNDIVWTLSDGTLAGTTSCVNVANPGFANCFSGATVPFSLSGSYSASSVLTASVTNPFFGGPNGINPTGLIVSGIANPVPEPGEWAMMLGGLATIGLLIRRRKNS